VGSLLPDSRLLVGAVALAAVAGAAADVAGRLPTVRRQVDETWLHTYRDWVYGGGFGFQLGLGVVTIVTSASTYLTWCLELASRDAITGLAIGMVFGLARALPLLAMGGIDDATELRRRHQRLAGAAPTAARTAMAGQAMAAVVLAVAAAGAM
jgi:hypothetical protein